MSPKTSRRLAIAIHWKVGLGLAICLPVALLASADQRLFSGRRSPTSLNASSPSETREPRRFADSASPGLSFIAARAMATKTSMMATRATVDAQGPPIDLVVACRAQATQRHAFTDGDMVEARSIVAARLRELDRLLSQIGSRGPAWREYLLWKATSEFAATGVADASLAEKLDRRWRVAVEAWSQPTLLQTSIAVRACLGAMRSRAANESPEQYAAAWNEIADLLANQQHGALDDQRLAAALVARERFCEAPLLTAAIRKELARPDVVVSMGRDWLESQLARRIDESYPIRGAIAGAQTSGVGHIVGQLALELLPSNSSGRWNLGFQGSSTSNNVAVDGGVVVRSRATTYLRGDKTFEWTTAGLIASPAAATASTAIAYDSIDAGGGPIRQRMAQRQTYARKWQAEQESAAMAASSLRARLDQDAGELSKKLNRLFHEGLRTQFLNADRLPLVGGSSSTAANLRCEWTAPLWRRLAAPHPTTPDNGLSLNLSAAAVEEVFIASLAGRKLNPQQLGDVLADLMGQPKSAATDSRTTFEFAQEPCEIRLHDDRIRITLRLAALETADGVYPAATIEATYLTSEQGGRLALARDGELTVRITADEPTAEAPASGRRQTLQIALRRALARAFAAELTWPPESSSADSSDAGAADANSLFAGLAVKAVSARDGWLQVNLATKPR